MSVADPVIFDVDQHACDLDVRWREWVPQKARDQAPTTVTHEGVSRLRVWDRLFPKPSGPGVGSPSGSAAGGELTWDARREACDAIGIHTAIMLPGNVGMALHAAAPDVRA